MNTTILVCMLRAADEKMISTSRIISKISSTAAKHTDEMNDKSNFRLIKILPNFHIDWIPSSFVLFCSVQYMWDG